MYICTTYHYNNVYFVHVRKCTRYFDANDYYCNSHLYSCRRFIVNHRIKIYLTYFPITPIYVPTRIPYISNVTMRHVVKPIKLLYNK